MSVVLERGASSERVDLGLDLSNETGIATVAAIYPEGSAAREGQLRAGDVRHGGRRGG